MYVHVCMSLAKRVLLAHRRRSHSDRWHKSAYVPAGTFVRETLTVEF
jgi:hypothetical protein